jgi:predicted transcriptional regulator
MAQSGDPLLLLAAQIVIAQIGHNDTPSGALPGLIRDVYQALASVGPSQGQANARPTPARKTSAGLPVSDDHLVCLECGMHMKMLKRHLQTVHDMTPAQYRAKFNLPGDYPLVARQYAALRSSLAKESGLGKRPPPPSG